jgi:nitroreductase
MNQVLETIQQRNASSKLAEPAPSAKELAEVFKAALRAPDHACLRPWRYLQISGAGREALGQLMLDANSDKTQLSAEQADKVRNKALRAPLIIVPIVKLTQNAKVPEIEQWLSAACGVQNISLALESLGYSSIWRTGDAAFNPLVFQGLGLAENERLLGFLYVGSRDGKAKSLPEHELDDFIRVWP